MRANIVILTGSNSRSLNAYNNAISQDTKNSSKVNNVIDHDYVTHSIRVTSRPVTLAAQHWHPLATTVLPTPTSPKYTAHLASLNLFRTKSHHVSRRVCLMSLLIDLKVY